MKLKAELKIVIGRMDVKASHAAVLAYRMYNKGTGINQHLVED